MLRICSSSCAGRIDYGGIEQEPAGPVGRARDTAMPSSRRRRSERRSMTVNQAFLATAALLLAGVMIPVPPGGRAVLWVVLLAADMLLWVSVGLGDLKTLFD